MPHILGTDTVIEFLVHSAHDLHVFFLSFPSREQFIKPTFRKSAVCRLKDRLFFLFIRRRPAIWHHHLSDRARNKPATDFSLFLPPSVPPPRLHRALFRIALMTSCLSSSSGFTETSSQVATLSLEKKIPFPSPLTSPDPPLKLLHLRRSSVRLRFHSFSFPA